MNLPAPLSRRLALALALAALVPALLCFCARRPAPEKVFVQGGPGMAMRRGPGRCGQDQARPPGGAGLDPARITVLDWNIHKEQDPGWAADLQRLAAGADIVFLQEALLQDGLVAVIESLGLYWSFNSAFRYGQGETGVLTASPLLPLRACGLRATEPLIRTPKTALVHTYAIQGMPGKSLLAANLHGINFTPGTATYEAQMDALARVLATHQGPIILAGDFNNWSQARTRVVNGLCNGLGLCMLDFSGQPRTTFFGVPVDQILYRGLRPLGQEVPRSASSDHLPLLVDFSLQSPDNPATTPQPDKDPSHARPAPPPVAPPRPAPEAVPLPAAAPGHVHASRLSGTGRG